MSVNDHTASSGLTGSPPISPGTATTTVPTSDGLGAAATDAPISGQGSNGATSGFGGSASASGSHTGAGFGSGSGSGSGSGIGSGAGYTGTGSTTVAPLGSRIPKALTWKDPAHSAIVLGEVLTVLFILQSNTLIRLGLRILYLVVGGAAFVEAGSRYLMGGKRGFLSKNKFSRQLGVNSAQLEKFSSKGIKYLTGAFDQGKKIIDAEDLGVSFGVGAYFWIAYKYTSKFTLSSFLFITTIAAFILTPVYLKFQKDIDHYAEVAKNEASSHIEYGLNTVKKASEPHLEKAKSTIDKYASSAGFNNRGGFPSKSATGTTTGTTTGTGPTGASSETTPATSAASHHAAPKITTTSSTTSDTTSGISTHGIPPEIQAAINAAGDDVASAKEVPTLIGNVKLEPSK